MNVAQENKKKKLRMILLGIGAVLCLVGIVWAWMFSKTEIPPLVSDYAPAVSEPGAAPVEEEADQPDVSVDGWDPIEYDRAVHINLSDNTATFRYIHPARSTQNIVLQIVVQDTVIARSGLITPGNQLKALTLLDGAAKKLSAGMYTDAQFKILSYDPQSGEKAAADTVAQIVLTVQE